MGILLRLGWIVMALLSFGVAAYAFFLVATGFIHVPLKLAENVLVLPWGLHVHIAASAVALAVGPLQFLRAVRSRWPAYHRWMGRIYAFSCLLGGAAGAAIAMYSSGGPIAGVGFLALAVGWVVTTAAAFKSALHRDFLSHERWMIRSFALTFAAVTLRLYLPIGDAFNGGDFNLSYGIIAWVSWVPNLLLAELWLGSRQSARLRTPG